MTDSFVRRLSSWKAKLLSTGKRLSLVKAVLGSLPLYFLSIFRAPNQVLNKVKSICYRFFWGFKDDEKKIVWIKWLNVLKSKSAGDLGFGLLCAKILVARVLRSRSGVWPNILRSIEEIKKIGVPLDSLMTPKIVSGEQTSFWNDDWLTAGVSLRESFPRLYALEIEKDCRLCDRWKVMNGNWQGVWAWRSPPRGGLCWS
ncbi:hypothetical protein Tco_0256882 [Tanacetum coccineum]